jgi:hypothetical protein
MQSPKPSIPLILLATVYLFAGVLAAIGAVFFVAFYDAPASGNDLGGFDLVFILSVIAVPFICFAAGVGMLILQKRARRLAWLSAAAPILAIGLAVGIGALINFSNCGAANCDRAHLLQTSGGDSAGTCSEPVPDGGDGLPTTACGTLTFGSTGSGTTTGTDEAHNWQFSTDSSAPLTIKVESNGEACPHLRMLDAAGRVVDDFADENALRGCIPDMITTGFFYFTPPAAGTYIIRITTPDSNGTYWLDVR